MAGSDHPADDLVEDGVDVSKSSLRSFIRTRTALVMASAAEVQSYNLSGQLLIALKTTGRIYILDTTDTTSAHDGVGVLVDANGLRFHAMGSDSDPVPAFVVVRVVDTTGLTPLADYQPGDTIDGITLEAGDLVLRAASSSSPDKFRQLNGIYVVPALTSPATEPSRHPVYATYDDYCGVYFSIMEGTQGDLLYKCTSNRGGVLGTDPLVIVAGPT